MGIKAGLLMGEHLGHRQRVTFGMARLRPHRAAALEQPAIELGEAAKAPLAGLLPDAPATVLDVLLHDALLPARGDVAEVGVEQVVRGHGGKARVDHPRLARLDLVNGGLHVVVDAAPRDPAERREAAGVGIEQHLMALAGIGDQHEGTAGTQLHVRHQQPPPHPGDDQPFLAPVELEGIP
jgi:hypothetical protein